MLKLLISKHLKWKTNDVDQFVKDYKWDRQGTSDPLEAETDT